MTESEEVVLDSDARAPAEQIDPPNAWVAIRAGSRALRTSENSGSRPTPAESAVHAVWAPPVQPREKATTVSI
ncbi:MAG: hypothetical protein V3T07_05135 [Myxococcota bacterium]